MVEAAVAGFPALFYGAFKALIMLKLGGLCIT
jgi:hypothetical protein